MTTAKVHTQSDFLGSPNARNIDTTTVTGGLYESGWATIDFTQNLVVPPVAPAIGIEDHTLADIQVVSDVYIGLPVTGFAVSSVSNGTLVDADGNSILSNYAGRLIARLIVLY